MYNLEQLNTIADSAHQSGLYTNTIGNRDAIFILLLSANEVNIPPAMALSGGIHPMKGKFEISARMINMLIRKAGHTLKIIQSDSDGCKVWGKRKDTGEEYEVFYGPSDAKKQGLGGMMYQKYGDDMYFARAITKFGRRLTPDCIGMYYAEGELQDVPEVKEELSDQQEGLYTVSSLSQRLGVDCKEVEEFLQHIHTTTKTPIDKLIERAIKNYDKFNETLQKWKHKAA